MLRKSPRKLIDVQHHVPGRTRIHIHKHGREHARAIHERLSAVPGVHKVEYNERTGSFLVHHSQHPEMLSTLAATTGEIATNLVGLVAEAENIELAGILLLAGMLLSGLARLAKEQVVPPRKPGVAHHSKRRTRLKLHKHHRTHHHMGSLKEKLEAIPGVHRVHCNHRTGSVTIHHDGSHETLNSVGGVVKDFSSELFNCIIKHEDPSLAGIHLFTEALAGGENENGTARGLGMAVIALLLMDMYIPWFKRLIKRQW